MIVGNVKNKISLGQQVNMERVIKEFIELVQKKDYPCGKYELINESYAIITENILSQENTFIEAHKKYLDIHLIIKGEELIKVGAKKLLINDVAYDSSSDSEILSGNLDHSIYLGENDYLVLFPSDAHMTGLCASTDSETTVKKIIFKIEYEAFTN